MNLHKFYTNDNEAFANALNRLSVAYSNGDKGLAARLREYSKKGWFMYSSPAFNAPPSGGTWGKAMPISCFGGYVEDTVKGLCEHTSEVRYMSVAGGGVSGYWGDIRAVGAKSPGAIPFLHTMDSDTLAYKQGKTRRAAYAAYMDIYHPDIIEFIKMRLPTGGDVNRKNMNIHHGVCIDDKFMDAVHKDLTCDLVDKHDGTVRSTIRARDLWQLLLETRYRTGEPYIFHKDHANRKLPQGLKDRGLEIHSSNLCTEIMLPTNKDRSFVCCLASVNAEYFDEWKFSTLVEDITIMLNNALDIFIEHAPPELNRAVESARRERSLGIGVMGYHAYLQKQGIPFTNSQQATRDIFKFVSERSHKQSLYMARDYGHYPDGRIGDPYNAHLMAVAPNANSSILAGTSPGIDPWLSNYFTQVTRAGAIVHKNKYLERELTRIFGSNTDNIWDLIKENRGSIQNIPYIPDYIKEIYETADEIDQTKLIDLARIRQQYIDQGQSVNVFFPAGADKEYVNQVHLRAFSNDGVGEPLKSLYYLRTKSGEKSEYVSNKIVCVGCD